MVIRISKKKEEEIIDEITEQKRKNQTRKCYNCANDLKYSDFKFTNMDSFTKNQLEKIWNDERIALLCCYCRKRVNLRIIKDQPKPKKLRRFF